VFRSWWDHQITFVPRTVRSTPFRALRLWSAKTDFRNTNPTFRQTPWRRRCRCGLVNATAATVMAYAAAFLPDPPAYIQ